MTSQIIDKELNSTKIAQGFMDLNTDFSIDGLGHQDALRFIELCEKNNINYTFNNKKVKRGFLYLKELNVMVFNLAGI